VGELVVQPTAAPLPVLTGYENHGGVTELGPDAQPAGVVRSGIGNGDADHSDGAATGRIWGTYMHGPVLARNPALADLLLAWVVGPLSPLDDRESEALRVERLRAAPAQASQQAGQARNWRGQLDRLRRRLPNLTSR
jgi:CobQ-like glutamine amidotransferase family enzyme